MEPRDDGDLTLVTLGGFALMRPADTQILGLGKPLALLTFLACSVGRAASREQLIDLLWSDADPVRARHALRQALWQLRQLIGENGLTGKEEIRLAAELAIDRTSFLEAVEAGELDRALAHYAGPFLADYASPGGAAFEHWAESERMHLRSAFVHAADLHARRLLAGGHCRDVVPLARRVVEAEPFGQLGRRLLITAHLGCGDAISAAVEAEAFRRWATEEDIQLEPGSLALLRRVEAPLNGAAVELVDDAPPPGRLIADLVGRESEFATILAAWSAAQQGSPGHLHLVAPAGLGKTRLLLDLEARLRGTGARVRYVRANPGDREIPGTLASEIARALASLPGAMAVAPAVAATLVTFDPSLANNYPAAVPDTASGNEAMRRRVLALAELVRATSDEGPFAFLIDDLHWADDESITLLEAVIARLDKLPVLVVSATRPHGDRQLRSDRRITLPLAPLNPTHVANLLESLAEFDSSEMASSIATQLHRASDGNPLMVLELLQLASERGTLRIVADRWSITPGQQGTDLFGSGDGIRQRFERLGPDSREVLTLLSLAGSPLDPETIAAAISGSSDDVSEQLAVLDRQGFAHRTDGGWQPAHDEIAAVAADISADASEVLHRRLGHAIEQHTDGTTTSLARAARHFVATGDSAAVARLVSRGLDQARKRGESVNARQLLTQLLGSNAAEQSLPDIRRLLPLRHRHRLAPFGIVALLLIGIVGTIGWRHHQESLRLAAIAARSVVFEAIWQEDTTLVTKAARISIDPTNWDPSRPPEFGPATDLVVPGVNWRMAARFDPTGTRLLASSMITSKFSPSQDILLVAGDSVSLLAPYPRDDIDPRFTPDGRGMIFVTTRWAPSERDDYDIGYMAFGDTTVRPIVDDRSGEFSPQPSPDGTRVAFLRNQWSLPDFEICIVHFDGTGEHCRSSKQYQMSSLDGWLDNDHLLGRGKIGTTLQVLSIDVHSFTAAPILDFEASDVSLDQDREFLLCDCTNPSDDLRHLYLYSLKQGSGAWLNSPTNFGIIRTLAVKSRAEPRYLDSLAIVSEGVLVPDKQHQLRTQAFDQHGVPFAFDSTTRRWHLISGPGQIDSLTGVLSVADTGDLTVEVTAGGWRSARKLLHSYPTSSLLLFEEDWRGELKDKPWRMFDTPPPRLSTSTGLGPVLLPNGDRTSPSGIYSTTSWQPAEGLTLEWQMATPLTLPVHQNIAVEFRAANDSLFLEQWSHVDGIPPGLENSLLGQCGMGYPYGEGYPGRASVSLIVQNRAITVPAPADQASGAIHTWRLAVFPDGSCGLAIDSEPVGRTHSPISFRWPLRLWVQGQSYQTKIAVGGLKIWRGDPGGVDWGSLGHE